jgi:hypothetical protein
VLPRAQPGTIHVSVQVDAWRALTGPPGSSGHGTGALADHFFVTPESAFHPARSMLATPSRRTAQLRVAASATCPITNHPD